MSTLKVNRIEPRSGDTVEIVGFDPGVGGKILQVVSEEFRIEATVGVNGALIQTAVKVSITPSSVNSRVMLHMNSGALNVADSGLMTGFFRGNTLLEGSGSYYKADTNTYVAHSASWVDSPNTTSEVTYTLGVDSTGGGVYWSSFDGTGKAIQLIAMEIGE